MNSNAENTRAVVIIIPCKLTRAACNASLRTAPKAPWFRNVHVFCMWKYKCNVACMSTRLKFMVIFVSAKSLTACIICTSRFTYDECFTYNSIGSHVP